MGGCCGGAPDGYTRRYQLVVPGKPVVEYDTKGGALSEQTRLGGAGRIQAVLIRNR